MNGPTLSTFPIRVHVGEVLDPDCKAMVSLSFSGRVLARMTAGTVATFAERVSSEVVRKQAIPVDDRPSAEPCSGGV